MTRTFGLTLGLLLFCLPGCGGAVGSLDISDPAARGGAGEDDRPDHDGNREECHELADWCVDLGVDVHLCREVLHDCLDRCDGDRPGDECFDRCGERAHDVFEDCLAAGGDEVDCEDRAHAYQRDCIQDNCDRPDERPDDERPDDDRPDDGNP